MSENIETVENSEQHVLKTRAPLWILAIVTGFFGLLYAYTVWSAIASLIQQLSGDYPLTGTGWAVLIAAIVVPIVIFAIAVAVGFKRAVGEYALILLTGFALVEVYWMNTLSMMFRAGCSFVTGNPMCG